MAQIQQENLLSRWSRRKQQTASESKQEDLVVALKQQNLTAAEIDNRISAASELKESRPLLTDEDMPAIETLHEESDFSGFMSSGVSDELRNLALKKLFKAPSFNVRDGLDEYDEDYTSFVKLGDIVTCDMKHQIEMEAKKKLEQEAKKLTENDTSVVPQNPAENQATPLNNSVKPVKTDFEPAESDSEVEERLLNDNSELTVTNTAHNNE